MKLFLFIRVLYFSSYLLSINFDVRDVVLEDSGDVHLRELVLAEDDQEASLPTRPVADDHQLLPDRGHCLEPYSKSETMQSFVRCIGHLYLISDIFGIKCV